MILLELFFVFFKIGLFTFGGGYAMIAMIRMEVVSRGWISESLLTDMIAVSESTPGPVAVNMATFIGASQHGLLGSLCATAGVVLPSFIVILIIASVFKNFSNNKFVRAFIDGVKPVIAALILFTGLLLAAKYIFPNIFESIFVPDIKAVVIFIILAATVTAYKLIRKKAFPPILLIAVSAALGMLFYTFF